MQSNARMPVSKIANAVGLSVPAASERLKRLNSSGVIRCYTAILSSEHLGRELTAIMFVSMEAPHFNDGFIDTVTAEPEVLECHYLAGDFDYSLKIVTHSTTTLESLLNRLKSVAGVQKTKTSVVLSTVKEVYSVTPDV